MKDEDYEDLVVGAYHSYDCRCSVCKNYWKLVGPEEVEDGIKSYGPFSVEEIEGIKDEPNNPR